MDQNRGNWYILTALILGISLGLTYSWVISPVSQVDTHPSLLRTDYKDIYRSLISRAYQANSNLPRAKRQPSIIGLEPLILITLIPQSVNVLLVDIY